MLTIRIADGKKYFTSPQYLYLYLSYFSDIARRDQHFTQFVDSACNIAAGALIQTSELFTIQHRILLFNRLAVFRITFQSFHRENLSNYRTITTKKIKTIVRIRGVNCCSGFEYRTNKSGKIC
jgi:hypothetical protein